MNIMIKSYYYVNRWTMDYNNIKKIKQCKRRFNFLKQYIVIIFSKTLSHLYHMDKFNF